MSKWTLHKVDGTLCVHCHCDYYWSKRPFPLDYGCMLRNSMDRLGVCVFMVAILACWATLTHSVATGLSLAWDGSRLWGGGWQTCSLPITKARWWPGILGLPNTHLDLPFQLHSSPFARCLSTLLRWWRVTFSTTQMASQHMLLWWWSSHITHTIPTTFQEAYHMQVMLHVGLVWTTIVYWSFIDAYINECEWP